MKLALLFSIGSIGFFFPLQVNMKTFGIIDSYAVLMVTEGWTSLLQTVDDAS